MSSHSIIFTLRACLFCVTLIALNTASANALTPPNAVGTIVCEGNSLGSATVLDISHLRPKNSIGAIILTAAHLLIDNNTKLAADECWFYKGGKRTTKNRIKLDFKRSSIGKFKFSDRQQITNLSQDWAMFYIDEKLTGVQALQARMLSPAKLNRFVQLGGTISHIGYSPRWGGITRSPICQIFSPTETTMPLPEGARIDDCGAESGSSGGAIVARLNQQDFVIGLRSGSIAINQRVNQSRIGVDKNTNAHTQRAIDESMLENIKTLVAKQVTSTPQKEQP